MEIILFIGFIISLCVGPSVVLFWFFFFTENPKAHWKELIKTKRYIFLLLITAYSMFSYYFLITNSNNTCFDEQRKLRKDYIYKCVSEGRSHNDCEYLHDGKYSSHRYY